jgi:hypothetical protein
MAIANSYHWTQESSILQRSYTCGHSDCGRDVASAIGWEYRNGRSNEIEARIYICPMCHRPSFFDLTLDPPFQIPGVSFGRNVEHLPEEILDLYSEIRAATSIGAYTSTVLSCRKMLMHIAVEKGAEKGKQFLFYVTYLVDNHYAPPGSTPWVDRIRQSGNEANHEIKIMAKYEAEELVNFVEMLLKFTYEFSAKMAIAANSADSATN